MSSNSFQSDESQDSSCDLNVRPTLQTKLEKIKSIITKEFKNEIENKQERLSIIDERLFEAKKILHRLRYAAVSNFYNPKKCELTDDDIQKEVLNQTDPTSKSKVHSILTNNQKRIHPAVKSVLSENATDNILEISTQRSLRKRSKQDEHESKQNITLSSGSVTNDFTYNDERLSKFIRIEDHTTTENSIDNDRKDSEKLNTKIPMYVEPKDLDKNVLKINCRSRNNQREKFRIIIGNTSQYIEVDSSQDRITHRWLLYIRGPPANPDISHIIDSITVQLHDSYIPHNIIKLKSCPFHLSRRGWGEFPIKLKIHFKNEKLNKPINVVHNLKLDRLHTGLQTLGAETIVDVWLYTDKFMSNKTSNVIDKINESYDFEKEDNTKDSNNHSNDQNVDNVNKILNSLNIKVENDESNGTNIEEIDNYFCSDSITKIKEEPMDIDDTYDETQENFLNENNYDFASHHCTDFSTIEYSFNDACDISSVYNLDNKPNSNDLFTSAISHNNDLKSSLFLNNELKPFASRSGVNVNVVNLTNSSILQSIYNDHCYFMQPKILRSKTEIDRTKHFTYSVEAKTISEILRKVDLQQIIDWFNMFDLNIILADNMTFNVQKIIELNKAVLNKIIDVKLVLNKKKLFNIQNIATINKIILSFYMKELSTSFWKLNNENLVEISNYINVLKEISSINKTFSNIQNSQMKSSYLETLDNEKYNEAAIIKRVLNILEDFINYTPKISNIRCLINMMLKNMPLIDKHAVIGEFQQLFPYVVENSDKYFSLNRVKRRNLQWTRAKMIHEFIKNFHCDRFSTIWSTKQILIFSQYHGYYPVNDNKIDSKLVTIVDCFLNPRKCDRDINMMKNINHDENFQNSSDINTKTVYEACKLEYQVNENNIKIENSNYDFCYISDSSDDEVDVCNDESKKYESEEDLTRIQKTLPLVKEESDVLPLDNEDERILCKYIENVCSNLGIVLRNQNIGHGYVGSQIDFICCKNFVEDLLRRSLAIKMAPADCNTNVKNITSKMNNIVEDCKTSNLFQSSSERISDIKKTSPDEISKNRNIWNMSESGTQYNISLKHIFEALKSRKEFDILTNSGLGLETTNFLGEV